MQDERFLVVSSSFEISYTLKQIVEKSLPAASPPLRIKPHSLQSCIKLRNRHSTMAESAERALRIGRLPAQPPTAPTLLTRQAPISALHPSASEKNLLAAGGPC